MDNNTTKINTATRDSATYETPNYHLPLFTNEPSSKPSWLVDWNGAMNTIDSNIRAIEVSGGGNTENIRAINQALQTAQNAITNLTNSFDDLMGLVQGVNTKADATETDVNKIKTDLITQNNLVKQLSGTVSALQTTVGELNTRVGTIETDLDGVNDSISNLQASLSGLDHRVNTMRQEVNKNKSDISRLAEQIQNTGLPKLYTMSQVPGTEGLHYSINIDTLPKLICIHADMGDGYLDSTEILLNSPTSSVSYPIVLINNNGNDKNDTYSCTLNAFGDSITINLWEGLNPVNIYLSVRHYDYVV